MLKFTLTIDVDDDVGTDEQFAEVHRVLLHVADNIDAGVGTGKCRDGSGNTVGTFGFED